MQPLLWQPPVEFSMQEEHIVKRIRKAKLFVFLRQHRHLLFDEPFQEELANLYRKGERGRPPVAPALLALALILEAYTGVSDDEVIEATMMDRRWQLVLDCVDTEESPFSKGTLVAFRQRLIEGQMDDGSLNEPSRLRIKAKHLARDHYVPRWIAARCGELDESRIPTILLATRSKRSCVWWLTSRGERRRKLRGRLGQNWSAGQA